MNQRAWTVQYIDSLRSLPIKWWYLKNCYSSVGGTDLVIMLWLSLLSLLPESMSVTNAANVTQTCAQTGWCSTDSRFGYSCSRHRTRAGVSAAWMTLPKAPLSVFMQVGDEMKEWPLGLGHGRELNQKLNRRMKCLTCELGRKRRPGCSYVKNRTSDVPVWVD